jgi:hypothetical protein
MHGGWPALVTFFAAIPAAPRRRAMEPCETHGQGSSLRPVTEQRTSRSLSTREVPVKFLCSICVKRESDTIEEIDGRDRPVCLVCVAEPVPTPTGEFVWQPDPTPRERVRGVIRRRPGLTFAEIRDFLDIPGCGDHKNPQRRNEYNARLSNTYCKAVERLAKSGEVERRGQWPEWTYWPAEKAS